jgi:flagellar hook-associated protein 2
MASIISSGIGSGLDIAGLVQNLVAAEAAPVQTRIGQQEARAQAKLSAFGSLKSALAQFRDKLDVMKNLDSFLSRAGSSGNEDLFKVTVGQSALPASYSVEVAQLAQSQKLTSGAFASKDSIIGTGTLTIAVGANAFNIEITDQNNTLAGIRNSINSALENSGVSATIVAADAGSYLILSGEKTGASNTMVITQSGGDGGLSALEYDPANSLFSLVESIPAQDALVRIDGLDIMSDSNVIDGAIEGVTINLVEAKPGSTDALIVSNDDAAVRQTIDEFVESYNSLVSTFDLLTQYDADADVAAPLLGDSTIRGIRDQIRREFSVTVKDIEAPFSSLSEIGIDVQLDGKLEVIDDDLGAILNSDFSKLGQLFANSDGYATRLFGIVDGFLQTGGIIETRTAGLNSAIDDFSEQRDALGERLASLESRLLRQFNALDSLVGELSSTSAFLTQQLSNLPGFTYRKNN